MKSSNYDIHVAKECISNSLRLINKGNNEQVIRDSFTSFLRQIFPGQPNWVIYHIEGSESSIKINKGTKISTGFIDNLVSLTAIEYESDLKKKSKYIEGLNQVKDYCSGLVNRGNNPELVIGVLSDTVRWFAYEIDIKELSDEPLSGKNIPLKEIDSIDCSSANETSAISLVTFLTKYLGRIGSRPISARAIAMDLGFTSPFCISHIKAISKIIESAFRENPVYTKLISELWCNFVSYLREEGSPSQFDSYTYVDEYYILTLGKLLCANYLEKKALASNDVELKEILNGKFFENRGFINFVEYDYFGWLNSDSYLNKLLSVAQEIQNDLAAYNFIDDPGEDIFGELMAQLANRSQRILLGQEWTPGWLSKMIVEKVSETINPSENLQLLDMCCGSGSMIVETVKVAKNRIKNDDTITSKDARIQLLIQSITGFDIDPLAVMLSKINWILTTFDWLIPLGENQISIPIYHADSLFAITPISKQVDDDESNILSLKIAEHNISLPDFLVSPDLKSTFDSLIDIGYHLATDEQIDVKKLNGDLIAPFLTEIQSNQAIEFSEEEKHSIQEFLLELIRIVNILNKEGRNGIWSYILRNSFRPGLVKGQFNGLVSNPPWLALSKVADNPYQMSLKEKAQRFGIKPQGSSHLHIELATIFLLHSVNEYLIKNSPIGCILPETVLNGHQHNPFRLGKYTSAKNPVDFNITTIWKIDKGVFKNNAIVLFGNKSNLSDYATLSGLKVSSSLQEPIEIYKNQRGNRTAWSEHKIDEKEAGLYNPAKFRQGADIMPRNLLFYDVKPTKSKKHHSIESIDPIRSPIAYTIKDAKKYQDFKIGKRLIPTEYIFDVLTSNLLLPFSISYPQKALLPIKKTDENVWQLVPQVEINSKGSITRNTFDSISKQLSPGEGNVQTIFNLINIRGKLIQQQIDPEGYLVFTGAGGGKVCAAFLSVDKKIGKKLIIDQTLYWAQVQSVEEALYLTGLLNSKAINDIIQDFQPKGAYGKRHVHKLPFSVTPPYDNSQTSHQEVVYRTHILIKEYREKMSTKTEYGVLIDPNNGILSHRRRKLFSMIEGLAAYKEYEKACRSLYGV